MIVYKITNLESGKVYVGQDSHNDPNYLGSGILIARAIRKHGKENFIKEVIDTAYTKEELNKKEIYWIEFYNCKVPNGYNLTDGGGGTLSFKKGKTLEEIYGADKAKELLEGLSERIKGDKNPAKRLDVKKKISEKNIGRKFPDQAKKMKEDNPAKRLEVREKIRKALIGRSLSKEHKKRIIESMKNEETRKKISEKLKGRSVWNKGLHAYNLLTIGEQSNATSKYEVSA